MRGGRFLISVVAACLLVGCSSGSWTTVETSNWVVQRSEAGLIYVDFGPAENCKISLADDPKWSDIEARNAWSWAFRRIEPRAFTYDAELSELKMRDCLGVKTTTNSDLFEDALYEAFKGEELKCRTEIFLFRAKRARDHEIPRREGFRQIWLEARYDEFGENILYEELDEEALEKQRKADDAWEKRTELDGRDETNRLAELKELDCEREERKAEQEAKNDD